MCIYLNLAGSLSMRPRSFHGFSPQMSSNHTIFWRWLSFCTIAKKYLGMFSELIKKNTIWNNKWQFTINSTHVTADVAVKPTQQLSTIARINSQQNITKEMKRIEPTRCNTKRRIHHSSWTAVGTYTQQRGRRRNKMWPCSMVNNQFKLCIPFIYIYIYSIIH